MIKKLLNIFSKKNKDSQCTEEKNTQKNVQKPVILLTNDDILMEFDKKRDFLLKK